MPDRSTETTVTSENVFSIGAAMGTQPPGTYRVVIDEDEVRGISFLAYHRVGTLLHTPAIGLGGMQQVFGITQHELDAAMASDLSIGRKGRIGR